MWLLDYLQKAFAFSMAYFRTLGRSAFDLVHDNVITKSQFGRFYWVSLFVCAFALFFYFVMANQYSKNTGIPECLPQYEMPFLSFFVLAEIASFVLLLGGKIAGWGVMRIWSADHVVLDENLKLATSSLTASQRAHVIGRRLYRQMWGWFPITLVGAVFLSQGRLQEVVNACGATRSLDSFDFLRALIWPGLIIAFAAVAVFNWWKFRWALNARSAFILSFVFFLYVAAAGVASPAGLLAEGLRSLPQKAPTAISKIMSTLFGFGI
jgi:hypothetical protein